MTGLEMIGVGVEGEGCCTLCNSNRTSRSWAVTSNANGRLRGECLVLQCADCGLVYSLRGPSEHDLMQEYSTGIYRNPGGRISGLVDLVLDRVQVVRIGEISRFKASGDLLDVGCGKGRFLGVARRRGWQVRGVETSPTQAQAARERYCVEVFEGKLDQMGFPDRSFDVVTMWHVLEHVPGPRALLAEVHRLLRPAGLLAIEVPNSQSWQARLGLPGWFQLDVPRHVSHFSAPLLRRLVEEQGFAVVGCQFFSLELGPYGMLQSLLNRTGLPPNWLYRWLKHSHTREDAHALMCVANAGGAIMLLPAAIALEKIASLCGAGGVVRLLAAKDRAVAP